MDLQTTSAPNQDAKNIALLTWIGTIFFGFIPSLIVYLVRKDDPFVQDHAKEALNWSITEVIIYAVSFVLTFILIGLLGFLALAILHLVFCIMGAVAASNGKAFRAPFALRLLK